MKITASMDLCELAALMTAGGMCGSARRRFTIAEAQTMRDYLVRDFPHQETVDLD